MPERNQGQLFQLRIRDFSGLSWTCLTLSSAIICIPSLLEPFFLGFFGLPDFRILYFLFTFTFPSQV